MACINQSLIAEIYPRLRPRERETLPDWMQRSGAMGLFLGYSASTEKEAKIFCNGIYLIFSNSLFDEERKKSEIDRYVRSNFIKSREKIEKHVFTIIEEFEKKAHLSDSELKAFFRQKGQNWPDKMR